MGTDIHYKFQAKNKQDNWEDLDGDFHISRHYQLFSVLADVRNGFGFAGVKTGDYVKPIAEPRGLPDDLLTVPVYVYGGHISGYEPSEYFGDHSFTHLYGTEMLEWWKNPPSTVKCGIITKDEFLNWEIGTEWEGGYCGSIEGHGIEVYDATSKDPVLLKYFDFKAHENVTHVRIAWNSSLKKELSYFFDDMVKPLVEKHGEIRLVMGFDS